MKMPVRRYTSAILVMIMTIGLLQASVILPELSGGQRPDTQDFGDPVHGSEVEAQPRDDDMSDLTAGSLDSVTWPRAGRAKLEPGESATVGGMPVTATKAATVEVADQTASHGIGLTVATKSRTNLSVDYSGFDNAYGGDFGSRLKVRDSQGDIVKSTNDSKDNHLTFTAKSGEFVIAADEASSQGDYKATELSPSSSWTVGGSAGGFNWSYPMSTPPTPGGLAPKLEFGYSSQTVDGRTSDTNNQGSWIGEGFSYEPGYIERRYKACADDGHDDKGDLCWAWDNATIMLNGQSAELVKDGDTWRLSSDDGSKVEKETGATNGDDDGEHWKVTTLDGTQYFFGLNHVTGWSAGNPETESVWTVPVFGDDADEPCHGATFAESDCIQAWRWNLDYVVDTHDNTIVYNYGKEINHYGKDGKTDANGTSYVRGGYLKNAEYGERDGSVYSTNAPARIVFDRKERCLPDSETTCEADELTNSTANLWPDVPWDLNCKKDTHCETWQLSPSFWTRIRVIAVTTQIWSGTSYTGVDTWNLEHLFTENGDGSRSLWLNKITHEGLVGGTAKLPTIDLIAQQKDNRVDSPTDNISPLIRPRISRILTDTGGKIEVNFADTECSAGDVPSDPATNGRRCFPVKWSPRGEEEPITDWFHKYVVASIVESDLTGQAPNMVTRYNYVGDAAWRHAKEDGITEDKFLTWGDWRGYQKVETRTGSAQNMITRTDTSYFTGMHGDEASGGGTKDVSIDDSIGDSYTDYDEYSGLALETQVYNGDEVISKEVATPWRHETASDEHSWDTQHATFVRPETTRKLTRLESGQWRETKTTSSYNIDTGLITMLNDSGDTSTSKDNRCTTTSYADNSADWIRSHVARIETVAVACGDPVDHTSDVMSDMRIYYDDKAFEAGPTTGDITKSEELNGYVGDTAAYVTVAKTTYDKFGRPTSTTDAADYTSTTKYTETNGLLTKQVETNPLGHESTSTLEPAWGLPSAVVDANDKRTEFTYDPLGRTSQVWLADRSKAENQLPNLKFSYLVRADLATAVKTERIRKDSTTGYQATWALYDGLLRLRQTQAEGPDGRLVTDTFYNSIGQIAQTNATYSAAGAPSDRLLEVEDGDVDGMTRFEYDGAARVIAEVFAVAGDERWRTTTSYGGDRTHVDPPTGGTATTTITDARGNITALRQYDGGSPTGTYVETRYGYTARDEMAQVTDPAGNVWKYEYDQRGHKTRSDDPDTGVTTYGYNDLGQLTTSTDARDVTLTNVYDELGRKTETSQNGTKLAAWFWDFYYKGQLDSTERYYDGDTYMVDTPVRDDLYRPEQVNYVIPESEGALSGSYSFFTAYNADGTIQTTSFPDAGGLQGEAVQYSYNSLQQVVGISGIADYADDFEYAPTGELSQVKLVTGSKDTWRTFFYEQGTNWLERARVDTLDNPVPVSDATYRYDAAGNVLSIADTPAGGEADVQCFSYDNLRRMAQAWGTDQADADCTGSPAPSGVNAYRQSYGFDLTGNRTSETRHAVNGGDTVERQYDYPDAGQAGPHQVQSVAEDSAGMKRNDAYVYDKAGNTTSRDLNGSLQTLSWDQFGKPTEVSEGDDVTSFTYDADGNRLLRKDASGATLYLPGVELRLAAGATEPEGTFYYQLPGGSTVVRTVGGITFQLADHHGTAGMQIDPDTGQVDRRLSDPYGNPRGEQLGTGVWQGNKGFVGGTVDPTGLTHLGAREYDQSTGRFISADPVVDFTDPQQINGYAYANNSPVTSSDPSGLKYDSRGSGSSCSGCKDVDILDNGSIVTTYYDGTVTMNGHVISDVWDTNWQPIDPYELAERADAHWTDSWVPSFYETVKLLTLGCGGDDATQFCDVNFEQYLDFVAGQRDASTPFMDLLQAAMDVATQAAEIPGTPFKTAKGPPRGLTAQDRLAQAGRYRCNSFTAGTEVAMADGTTKDIDDIEVGDEVLATDPKTGDTKPQEVTDTPDTFAVRDLVDITIDTDDDGHGDDTITTTAGHAFWTADPASWQPARNLEIGSLLRTSAGTWVSITAVEHNQALVATYNLTVDKTHTYYVVVGNDDALVHNCPAGGQQGRGLEIPDGASKGAWLKGRAAELGFNQRIPPQKLKFDSKGQAAFSNGKYYITPDVTGHNTMNGWKVFDKKGNRVGTYDANMNYLKE